MIVNFQKVRWKNFLGTGNSFNEIVLDKNHTTLLTGSSGSGKSTLLDAIAFALFDKPFRSINKDQLVNSINERGCLVEIEFKIGSKQYQIKRGRKPNIFEIYVDGALLNQDAASKDYQKYLETHILKFNCKSFMQIVVLGASNFTPFMQLKAADRRTIIENLLDIEVFSVMNLLLKDMIDDLKEDSKENLSKIENTTQKIRLHEKFIVDLQKDNEQKIEENKSKIQQNKESSIKLDEQIQKIEESVKSLTKSLDSEKQIQTEITELISSEQKIEQNIKRIQKELDFYSHHDECPTCKQQINHEFKENEIKTKKDKITEYNDALSRIDEKIKKFSVKQNDFKLIHDNIDKLRLEQRKHQSNQLAISEYVKKIEKENQDLSKPRNNIENEKLAIKELTEEIKGFEENKEKFAFEKNINEIASSLLKDSGVKSQIIKQYLPIINNKINQYLQEMDFFVTFHIDENFNESIRSRGRDDLSYANFSEGEKQRIDLALLFTWRSISKMKNSVNTNLLILDEVFDSYLGNSDTENVIQLLKSVLFKDMNIFVISHKETITDKFDINIKFSKQNNFSVIE